MSGVPSSKCVRKEINMLAPASAHRLQMTSYEGSAPGASWDELISSPPKSPRIQFPWHR